MRAKFDPQSASYSLGITTVRGVVRDQGPTTEVYSDVEMELAGETVKVKLVDLVASGSTPQEAAATLGRWLSRLGGALTALAEQFPQDRRSVPWAVSVERPEPEPEPEPRTMERTDKTTARIELIREIISRGPGGCMTFAEILAQTKDPTFDRHVLRYVLKAGPFKRVGLNKFALEAR